MVKKRPWQVTFKPGSKQETALVVAPFILIGAVPALLVTLGLSAVFPMWFQIMTLILLGGFSAVLIMGFANRVPRWSLPYLGLPLPLLSVLIGDIAGRSRILPPLPHTLPWLPYQVVSQGTLWAGLLVAPALILAVTSALPPLRPIYAHLRQDWTRLSFLLYGATVLVILFTFDEYQDEELYVCVAMLFLAGGGWLYLHSRQPSQRFLSLWAGVSLAILTATIGKAILFARMDWSLARSFTWQTEAISTLITGAWTIFVIAAPALLMLLPEYNRDLSTQRR